LVAHHPGNLFGTNRSIGRSRGHRTLWCAGAGPNFDTISGSETNPMPEHGTNKRVSAISLRTTGVPDGAIKQFERWDRLLGRLGLSAKDLCREVDVHHGANATSFVPYRNFIRVLRAAERSYGTAFVTDLVRTKTVADFDILGYLFVNAPDLRSSLETASDCLHVVNSHCEIEIGTADQAVTVRYLTPGILPEQNAVAAEIATLDLVLGIRHYLDQWDWSPTATFFEHAPRDNAVLLKRFIGGHVNFGQPCSGIQMPKELMKRSSPHAEVRLFEILCQQRRAKQPTVKGYPVDIVAAVTSLVEAGVQNGRLSAEEIADALALSKRTLYRRLKECGTSISEIRQATLMPIAKEMLSRSLDVSTVAYRIGYSDCRSFGRAFKRATNMTPAEYRCYMANLSSIPLPKELPGRP
jgi:AraC-like DNA-binding protein